MHRRSPSRGILANDSAPNDYMGRASLSRFVEFFCFSGWEGATEITGRGFSGTDAAEAVISLPKVLCASVALSDLYSLFAGLIKGSYEFTGRRNSSALPR
jgi:hypothetical protein